SGLERRIDAMLNTRLNRRPLTRATRALVVGALLAATLVVAGLAVSAQTTATFSGTIMDATGRIIPDTQLALVNAAANLKFEAVSDATGHFSFVNLPAGEYAMQANKLGF